MIIKPIKNKKEANKTKPRRCWKCCMAQTTELQTELQVGTSSHLDSRDENTPQAQTTDPQTVFTSFVQAFIN